MTRNDQLARAYVEAHGLTAISVVDMGGRLLFQIETFDPAKARTLIDWKVPRPACWWVADGNTAKRVFEAAPDRVAGDVDDMTRAILLGAERARVRLTDHDVLMRRAAQAVQLVETRLRDLKNAGGLKALNTEYKDLRARRTETGRNIEPFPIWLHKRKIDMVEKVARAAGGRPGKAR